jgi:hypothetical protein
VEVDGRQLLERAHGRVDERDVVAQHAGLDLVLPGRRKGGDLFIGAEGHHIRPQRAGRPLGGDLVLVRLDDVVVVVVVAEAVRESRGEHSDEALLVRLMDPTGDVVELVAVPARAVQHEHHRHVLASVHGGRHVDHHLPHHPVHRQVTNDTPVRHRLGHARARGDAGRREHGR